MLRFLPHQWAEHRAALVDRQRMAEYGNRGILQRVWESLPAQKAQAIEPWNENRGNRVPSTDKMDGCRPRRAHPAEMPSDLKIVFLRGLFIGLERIVAHIELFGSQQPDHMDEARQNADRVGALLNPNSQSRSPSRQFSQIQR